MASAGMPEPGFPAGPGLAPDGGLTAGAGLAPAGGLAVADAGVHTLTSAKIVVAGGFAVGKTTCVGSISEIPPVNTEAWMTAASEPVDPLDAGVRKATTTVAMDFGRLTIAEDLVLYLFGTPGQPRFWPMWDDLSRGAIGALVLADTRRLDASFAAINYFEQDSNLPFVVAVNMFDGILTHDLAEVRTALALPAQIPLTTCDARNPSSVAQALLDVVELAMTRNNPARRH